VGAERTLLTNLQLGGVIGAVPNGRVTEDDRAFGELGSVSGVHVGNSFLVSVDLKPSLSAVSTKVKNILEAVVLMSLEIVPETPSEQPKHDSTDQLMPGPLFDPEKPQEPAGKASLVCRHCGHTLARSVKCGRPERCVLPTYETHYHCLFWNGKKECCLTGTWSPIVDVRVEAINGTTVVPISGDGSSS
jgi:hypothetical protein